MQHLKVKIEFRDVKPFEKLEYDHQLTKKGREEDLKRFVKTYYSQDLDSLTHEEFNLIYVLYQGMIDAAIILDNLMAVEILWQGVYYHDRSHPDFVKCAYTAANFGTLKMFQHCMYAFMNYMTYDPWTMGFNELQQQAEKNSNRDVLEFVKLIAPCAKDGKLEQLWKGAEKEIEGEKDEDMLKHYQSCIKFYQLVESF